MDTFAKDTPSVALSIPAQERYLKVVRLATSALVSDLGWDVEGIDDMKVALSEACLLLMRDATPSAVISLTFSCPERSLHAVIALEDGSGRVPADFLPNPSIPQSEEKAGEYAGITSGEVSEVDACILRTLVDEVQFMTDKIILYKHCD